MKAPQIKNLQEITPKEAEEYIRFVKELRDTQKRYFKTRSVGTLKESKEMEKELDALNEKLLAPPQLF